MGLKRKVLSYLFHSNKIHSNKKKYSTIPYQGIFSSMTYFSRYTPNDIVAPTGEHIKCEGRNNFPPINVLVNPFVGKEIQDVDPNPFKHKRNYLNPLKVVSHAVLRVVDWHTGVKVEKIRNENGSNQESINSHALNISEISIGQGTDIQSHLEKYQLWKKAQISKNLILWGNSRGAATTFIAEAKYKYPEVNLVILEGCFYSFEDLLKRKLSHTLQSLVSSGLGLITKYNKHGPSPSKSVKDFPENIPVVFITSEIDWVVPCESSEKLAQKLADRGTNDVYFLKLKRSSHTGYPFDDAEDRDNYQCLVQAIYQKYHIPYDIDLARRGQHLLQECLLKPSVNLEKRAAARVGF